MIAAHRAIFAAALRFFQPAAHPTANCIRNALAKALGTNARGLKNIVDNIVLPYQFDAAEMRNKGVNKIQITSEVVDKSADPVLLFKKPDAKKQQNK